MTTKQNSTFVGHRVHQFFLKERKTCCTWKLVNMAFSRASLGSCNSQRMLDFLLCLIDNRSLISRQIASWFLGVRTNERDNYTAARSTSLRTMVQHNDAPAAQQGHTPTASNSRCRILTHALMSRIHTIDLSMQQSNREEL